MEKVRLPKEVAEAIEEVWSKYGNGYTKHMVLTNWSLLKEKHEPEHAIISSYGYCYPIELMKALVSGYEVEQTPEETVKALYSSPDSNFVNPHSYRMGMKDALNAYGIKIEGVNA